MSKSRSCSCSWDEHEVSQVRQEAPAGYGFCALCGGLFELKAGKLPPHGWVGHGVAQCPGTEVSKEGEVSP